MRAIFLNTWQGKKREEIRKFIQKESVSTDFFCFQEVSPDFFEVLKSWLSGYASFYRKGRKAIFDGKIYGQAIFLNAAFKVGQEGKFKIYNQLADDIGFMQYVFVTTNTSGFWLGNIHGKTKPGNKKDTKTRIMQSEKIINFFDHRKTPIIFGGDFNLMPGTKSIKMFEDAGYRNLISDFKIKNTRNSISWEQFKDDKEFTKQHFADYVFVSSEVKVKSFEVPYMEISDHLPLILDFDLPPHQLK